MTNKVIIITPWFGKFSGGAESLAKSLAIEFNNRGIESIIFTTCCQSPYHDWWTDQLTPGIEFIDGIQVHRFVTNKQNKSKYQATINKISSNELLTSEDRYHFFYSGINSQQLVDSLPKYFTQGYSVIALPFFQGLTHNAVNSYPHKISLIPCFHDENQFYWDNTSTLLSNAKNIFFNTLEEKQLAIKQYGISIGKNIIESPVAGIGVNIIDPSLDKISLSTLPKDYFIYVGKKDNAKNIPTLCQWFEFYHDYLNTHSKLVFVGGGDPGLIPPKKFFIDLGFLSESQKYNAIKHSKALINLSQNESFSIVIMESWLLNKPIVVYGKCPVTTGHVKKSNGGLYPNNMFEFALSLKYILDNPDISKLMGENGHQYVQENYNFDHILNIYLNNLT